MQKKYRLFLMLWVLIFCSCQQHSPAMTELVYQRFAAMNKHDLKAIDTLYADSALIESPNFLAPEKGRAGIHSVYDRYFISSPDLHYTITRILPGDSSITVEYTSTGTMKHLEGGGPAYMLDKKYTLKNCTILEIRNNRIVRDVSYFD